MKMLGELQIVVEKHSDVLRNNALPFRILIFIRVIGFLLCQISAVYGFLTLNPNQLFSIEIWRLVTSPFIGKNIILLAWSIWSLHYGTNLVRQANTNEALLKAFLVTQLLTTLCVTVLGFLLYAMFDYIQLLYHANLVDLVAVNASVLVLIKQFLPDSIVLATPFGRIKYTHVPFLAICVAMVASLLDIVGWYVALQVAIAVQVSWTYLRFFNPHETDEVYGDSSEHFTWASLFPRRIQPICTVCGRIVFRSLVKLGVCKRQVRHVDLNSLDSVGISLPALDSSARDAERRRQKALRDLNDRLNRAKKLDSAKVNWDEDDDAGTSTAVEPVTTPPQSPRQTVDTEPRSSEA